MATQKTTLEINRDALEVVTKESKCMKDIKQLYYDSAYTINALALRICLPAIRVRKWIFSDVKPSKKNAEKFDAMIALMKSEKRLKFHPAYGYATPEQFKRLVELSISPERDELLKVLDEQNRNEGKFILV